MYLNLYVILYLNVHSFRNVVLISSHVTAITNNNNSREQTKFIPSLRNLCVILVECMWKLMLYVNFTWYMNIYLLLHTQTLFSINDQSLILSFSFNLLDVV